MTKNKIWLFIGAVNVFVLASSLFYGCASIQQPQGGPKDSLPPKVLRMVPTDQTVNFKAQTVVIDFDEYFKLQDQFKEFSISPEVNLPPILKERGRRLEIQFQDTLEANTTYTLNFGKSIADVNERNAIKNFTYVFSTGPQLDSLSISGKVTNALTGEPELDALAFILPLNRDTLLGKGKPTIYTRTDSSGNYQLKNLREGSYRVYALKEEGGDKIYQQNIDEIGFIADTINLKGNISNQNIKIFREHAKTFRLLERTLNTDGSIDFAFNQQLRKPEITVTEPANLNANKITRYNRINDSVRVWLSDLSFDSVKFDIKDDGKLLQNVKLTRGKKDTYTRNILPADNLEGTRLNPNKPLQLFFNLPIEKVDPAKVILLEDSVRRTNFTIKPDSSDILTYTVTYPWKANRSYEVIFEAGALTAIFNAQNKEFVKKFELNSSEDYGSRVLNVKIPDTGKTYILEIVNDKRIVLTSVLLKADTTVRLDNYRAGTYYARVVYDNNRNGKWDTGDVAAGIQPENIWYNPQELSIRANWEINDPLTIPKE